ncbi:MAG: PAS domain S-box protein [Cyanobacteria bacterium P01_E01_bin.6]
MNLSVDQVIQPVPFTITPDTSVRDAIALMGQHNVTYVLIEADHQLQGIFTSSDLVRWVASGKDGQQDAIAQVMTQHLITYDWPGKGDLSSVYQHMQKHEIHHLPVVNQSSVLQGMITFTRLCHVLHTPLTPKKETHQKDCDNQWHAATRFTLACELSSEGLWELNPETGQARWNDTHCRLMGLEPGVAKATYGTWVNQIHPEDRQKTEHAFANAIETRRDFSIDYRIQCANGVTRWVLIRGRVDESVSTGNATRMGGVSLDITERKRIEEALKLSEAKNRAVLNAIPDLLFLYQSDGTFQEVIRQSNSLDNLIDKLPDTVNPVGQHVTQILPPDVASRQFDAIQAAIATGNVQIYEQEIVVGDHIQYEDVRISPIDDETVLGMVRDIGERKHREKILRQYQWIFHSTMDGMALIDRNYRYRLVNQTYLDWHQREASDVVGQHMRHLLGDQAFEHSLKSKLDQCLQGKTLKFEKWSEFDVPQRRYLGIHYVPYRENDGTIRGIVATFRDLTELKLTTEALEKSEAQNRAIVEALPDLLVWVNYKGDIRRYLLPSECDKSRYVYAQHNINEVLNAENTAIELTAVQQAIDTNILQIHELEMPKYGRLSFEEIRVARIDDQEALIIVRDITERKQIEQETRRAQDALKTQMNFLQSVIDAIPSSVFVKNRDGQFLLANQAAAKTYGQLSIDMTGQKDSDFNSDVNQIAEFLSLNQKVMDTRTTLVSADQLIPHPTRGLRWYQTLVSPWIDLSGNILGVIGNCVDITERKTLELALRKSEATLQDILSSVGAAVRYFRFFPNGQWETLYCSPMCEDLFRCRQNKSFAECWLSNIQHEDIDAVLNPALKLMQQDQQTCIEYRFRHPDGSIRWIADTLTSRWDDDQQSWLVTAVGIDISNRQRMEIERHVIEDALRGENQFRSQIIDQMAEGLCVCYEVSEFPYVRFSVWNQHMTEITGYTETEINTYGWYQSLYPDPKEQARAIKRMAQMRHGNDLRNEEWVISRSDGQVRTVAISTTLLNHDSGTPLVLAVMQDVSDRKQAEQRLQQSLQEKNLLLSEVHHRVKNNLQVIISLLTLQANRVHDPLAQQTLKRCSDRVYAMALVHEKLYRTQQFEGISLGDYIREFVDQVVCTQELLDTSITTRYQLDDSVELSLAQAIQVSLILNELVTNALKHGTPAHDGIYYLYVELTQHHGSTVLSVGNHGASIPDDFSLTASRQSMGLTLVQVLAEQINGAIHMEPGDITWFKLRF